MKTLVQVARIIVGVLFIFSGLVKANDPIGLSYKMQEFFLVWGMSALDGIALTLSVVMIAFEIIAGAALLLGWRIKTIAWLLLLLIAFFTFLTGYAFLSGKFKNCGCFGDCLPITAQTSFIKDILLLILILLIFFNTKYIRPLFPKTLMAVALVLVTLFSFAAQWYTLQYLPVADCLPLREGNHIAQQMKLPADAIADSTVITFVYDKNGERVEFTAESFPDDFNDSLYHFVSRYDKVIRPGVNNEPPLKSFSITAPDGQDLVPALLEYPHVVVLFVEDASAMAKWSNRFGAIHQLIAQKRLPLYIVTSTKPALERALADTPFSQVVIGEGDATMIRVAARTNPTLYLIQKGTVAGKWSYRNFDAAATAIATLPAGSPGEH